MKPANPTRSPLRVAISATLLLTLLAGCGEAPASIEALRQQQKDGEYAATIEPLRGLLAANPGDAETNFLYGRALAMTTPHIAGWSLRKAMEDPEWYGRAGNQLALLALVGLDFKEAIKICNGILEREPENTQTLLIRANAYAHSRQAPEEAIADARRLLELDPKQIDAYEALILGLVALERLDEAEEALADAGRLLEEDADPRKLAWHCVTTAILEQEAGQAERAKETLQRCLEAHPSDPDVVESNMALHEAEGNSARALEIARAAHEAAPKSPAFRAALVQRLAAAGHLDEAEAMLIERTESDEPILAASGWMSVAKLRLARKNFPGAADALGKSTELLRAAELLTPQNLFEYADALVLAEQYDRALEVADEMGVEAHAHLIRGRVAQERRDPAAALAEYDQALLLWPDNPWARYYAALAAEDLGDFPRAIEEYRSSIRISPGAADARARGAKLLAALGNPAGALVVLQHNYSGLPLNEEELLTGLRIAGGIADPALVTGFLEALEEDHPTRMGEGLAAAAAGLDKRGGPALAAEMLATAPLDLGAPDSLPALQALVRYAHRAGEMEARREAIEGFLAKQPDSGPARAIRALDLELSGAPSAEVAAAYESALELAPADPWALAGLARATVSSDAGRAVSLLDRAAAADPRNAAPKIQAVLLLVAGGRADLAAERIDALLVEHPVDPEAAAAWVRVDLARDIASDRTLERALRAVQLGGGPPALELLSEVYSRRGEDELAARAAERAHIP